MKRYLLFALSLIFLSLLSGKGFAERPFFETESAIPTPKGTYRLEGGLGFSRLNADQNETVLQADLRYGLIQNLEFDLEIPYLFVDTEEGSQNRLGDMRLNTKIRFLKGRAANPLSISGQMVIKFPTAGRKNTLNTTGVVDVGFRAIASKAFTPLIAHINLGYFFIGNPAGEDLPDQIHYALGLEHETVGTALKTFGEIFGRSNVESAESNNLITIAGGFSFQTIEDLIFDISTGFGLTNDSPDYVIQGGATFYYK
ncbi:MAG: transporter [Nitrospiria bacterium]